MAPRKKTSVSKGAVTVPSSSSKRSIKVASGDDVQVSNKLTQKEIAARKISKYATTTFGFNTRKAFDGYGSGGVSNSQQGNFYSPQLSTDFLEKPQNLRERRAWYRHFYNSNEFVGQAIDLHSTLPLSKIRLEKPKGENEDQVNYMYDFFVEMAEEMNLTQTLMEISHEYWLLGNCGPGYSLIRIPDGYKRADEIQIGDTVLTHKGHFRRVVKGVRRKASELLNITTAKNYRPLEVTAEHPIEVLRGDSVEFIPAGDINTDDYIRMTWPTDTVDVKSVEYITERESLTLTDEGYDVLIRVKRSRVRQAAECRTKLLSWLSSLDGPTIRSRESLRTEFGVSRYTLDNVVLQLRKEIGAFTERVGADGYQGGSRVKWYPIKKDQVSPPDEYEISRIKKYKAPHTIDIDEDFCYVLGYWLGDGTLARDTNRKSLWGRGLWQISFGDSSEAQRDRVRKILIDKFGDSSVNEWETVREYANRETRLTTLKVRSNPALIEWWASNFGETSHGENKKHIPDWVINLPTNKLAALLAGVVDSDGHVGTHVCIALTSEGLQNSIREIALKCGVSSSFRKKCAHDIKENLNAHVSVKSRRDVYLLSLSGPECSEIFRRSVKQPKQHMCEAASKSSKWYDSKFFVRVSDIEPQEYDDYVYNFEVEEDHTYQINGFSTHNCFIFCEDHDPYEHDNEDYIKEIKAKGKVESERLFKEFEITDKDPNYAGWRRVIILPPDQVRIKKIPLSDESRIEFIPDPETRKTILRSSDPDGLIQYGVDDRGSIMPPADIPEKLITQLKENGSIPLDTDPYSGSYCYHLARKKSQYETQGVSILERCVNTLLLQDKLRQAQTSIASRHMTPIRIVWAEDLSEVDVDNLREQVDLALVDPDYSIIANFQVHWEEMGSNGRLLELSTEYDHIESSLFAGLGVTREILTGEGTYSGNRITLEIMNAQYVLYRELLQNFVENYLFKPVAKKKGFVEKDKYGREKLLYPRLSFSRLAIRDNDAFFDQVFQLYNKGSVSIDIILDMLNIDPISTQRKIEADLFTTNDFAFNQLMINIYTAVAQQLVEKFDVSSKLAGYLDLPEAAQVPGAEGMPPGGDMGLGGLGAGGAPPMPRFASDLSKALKLSAPKKMSPQQQAALRKVVTAAMQSPQKMDKILKYLQNNGKA